MRRSALAILAASAALLGAAPAFAQPLDELTVTGQLRDDRAQSLSETVSYADLDLSRYADRQELLLRVNNTARRLCVRLNQDYPSAANLGRSCQDYAVRGAMGQVRQAFADAASPAYVDAYGAPVSATVPDRGPYPYPYDN
jgi:UrcA family protein